MGVFNRFLYLKLFFILFCLQSCSQASRSKKVSEGVDKKFYTVEDFKSVKKIDAHVHMRTDETTFVDQAIENHFQLININVYKSEAPNVEEQRKRSLNYINKYPNQISYVTAFSLQGWGESDWYRRTIEFLDTSIAKGAIGVKVWKEIGMELKDKNNNFVMIDHPKLDPVFDYIAKNKLTLLSHQGEPKDCWLPLDKMESRGNRNYYSGHPEYHMFQHPEYPSYEDQIRARDNMLAKHPDMKVVCVHLASLEWSIEELAKRFDKYPNMAVDMAARIEHLQLQAKDKWQEVHDFFLKYQDRIIYGTDIIITVETRNSPEKRKSVDERWRSDWIFLTTDEVMNTPEFEGDFRGLKLPREVVDKIYYGNAQEWFAE